MARRLQKSTDSVKIRDLLLVLQSMGLLNTSIVRNGKGEYRVSRRVVVDGKCLATTNFPLDKDGMTITANMETWEVNEKSDLDKEIPLNDNLKRIIEKWLENKDEYLRLKEIFHKLQATQREMYSEECSRRKFYAKAVQERSIESAYSPT